VNGATTRYVYDAAASLPLLLDDGGRKYVWGPGLAYAVDGDDAAQVYHADGLGSVRAISDSTTPTPQVVQTSRTDELRVPVLALSSRR
jgi:hypothetical protein